MHHICAGHCGQQFKRKGKREVEMEGERRREGEGGEERRGERSKWIQFQKIIHTRFESCLTYSSNLINGIIFASLINECGRKEK
jgi:hypothetical protein